MYLNLAAIKPASSFAGSSGGAERKDANVSDEVDSDKEVKSVSKGNLLEEADCPNPNIEDSDEEMPDSEGRPAEDMDSIGQDAQNNGDEKLPSEETETEEVNRASSREGNEEESSDSEGNQEKDDVRGGRTKQKKPHLPVEPSSPSVAGDLELSDDEPLVLIPALLDQCLQNLKVYLWYFSLTFFFFLDAGQFHTPCREKSFKESTVSGSVTFTS